MSTPERNILHQRQRPVHAALAAAALFASALSGAPALAEGERHWTASLLFENDLFGNTDRDYTNGIRLGFTSPDLTEYRDSGHLPPWALALVRRLPFINEPGLQRNVAFGLEQKIFTPEDTQATALIASDRPYAGWLYFSSAFHNKNDRRLDTMEVQLGVVGPAALGRQAQNFVHRLRDIPTAKGWANQLDNEPGIALVYERKWRLLQTRNATGIGFDLIGHAGGALGNVAIYANAGAEVRFGINLPADFGLALIRPGGDASAPADSSDPRLSADHDFGAHLFAALGGRAVARDLFLDGNTFSDSHGVSSKALVGDLIVGASVLAGGVKASYAQVFRTREFSGQRKRHNFGSITLSWTY